MFMVKSWSHCMSQKDLHSVQHCLRARVLRSMPRLRNRRNRLFEFANTYPHGLHMLRDTSASTTCIGSFPPPFAALLMFWLGSGRTSFEAGRSDLTLCDSGSCGTETL